MFSFGEPSPSWINLNDCGDFTCTGLYQLLVEMKGTTYIGSPNADTLPADYQVTPNNEESVSIENVNDCTFINDWNAYRC